jgi:hypothetical protein
MGPWKRRFQAFHEGETAMALDIVIPAESVEPEITVPIRVNEHARLLGIVDDATLPLLSRLRDYYGDAEYEPQDLDSLAAELESVAERVQTDNELVMIVVELMNLVTLAKRLGRKIVAIAD